MADFPTMSYKAPEPEEALPEIDAHGYLQGVYRGLIKPNGSRLRAAMAALPFEKPKLAVHAQITSEDLAERLLRAMAASAKVIDARPAMQVIEASPVDAGEPSPAPDHSKPFARFRRF